MNDDWDWEGFYDEIEDFLKIFGEPETPALLGDAETTLPLNINPRPEPVPSQFQYQPPPPQLPLSSSLHAIQDLDQSRQFGYNEPNVSLCETSNRTAQFQRGHFHYQELNTPFATESLNSLLASTEGNQNLYTVPPHNFGYGEPIGSLYETSNRTYQLQRGHSHYQELYTPSVEFQTLFPLPPLNINFNEPGGGGSSIAADSSQQQFSSNLPMWHENQLNIGSFDSGPSSSTEVSSSSSSSSENQQDHHEQVVPPNELDPLTIQRNQYREEAKQRYFEKKRSRKFVKAHRYESRAQTAAKKKRSRGRFVKNDDEFDNDPPAIQ
ncbi:unnamed protein product [Arabidopsis thaliana]|uniref:(thale cress) hypothetical protein n=1 Tax=Arabidopsis thaliana TaxID=3702 RepID=A0A654F8S6_ARATH|nr:unnamed protein product [Arabidopsis thaliana]VYS54201.1 unnamed protein product [Arabidopsis thaliana]